MNFQLFGYGDPNNLRVQATGNYLDLLTGRVYQNSGGRQWRLASTSPTFMSILSPTANEKAAMDAATSPSATNPFVTISALPVVTTPGLPQVLATGNTTGGTSVIISSGDFITDETGDTQIDLSSGLVITTDAGGFGTPYVILNTTKIELASLSGGGVLLNNAMSAVSHNTLIQLSSPSTQITSVGGAGNRMVVTNNAGVLSTAALPSAPLITSVDNTGNNVTLTVTAGALEAAIPGLSGSGTRTLQTDNAGDVSIIPPSATTGTTAGFTPNASANAVFNESTFSGGAGAAYTINDLVLALKAANLLVP